MQATLEKIHAALTDTPLPPDPVMKLLSGDPNWLALAAVTTDGEIFHTGDAEQMFPLQSMSKAFTYGMALEDRGRAHVLAKIGVEPTAKKYNAIVLDDTTGRPLNPMVNAGSIAVASLISGANLTERVDRVSAMLGKYVGRTLLTDAPTLSHEFQTEDRNRAMGHLMRSFGILDSPLDDALHLYFQHCSLLVNTVDLAKMAATLANRGVHPITGETALRREFVRDVLSVLFTCGMYDTSGEWSYHVGLPAKSGISGGIFAVLPGRMGIAAFSPPLDEAGHSERGMQAFRLLATEGVCHIFEV